MRHFGSGCDLLFRGAQMSPVDARLPQGFVWLVERQRGQHCVHQGAEPPPGGPGLTPCGPFFDAEGQARAQGFFVTSDRAYAA